MPPFDVRKLIKRFNTCITEVAAIFDLTRGMRTVESRGDLLDRIHLNYEKNIPIGLYEAFAASSGSYVLRILRRFLYGR